MTTPRDPDRQIHAFLLEGDELLNDQVYDVVRAEVERKRQRTFIGPWRTPIMNKIVTYGLGAAAVVVLLLVGSQFFGSSGGLGSPTATPTPEPTATPEPSLSPPPLPPLTQSFTSPLHGYSVSYPEGWAEQPATEPWGAGRFRLNVERPNIDVLYDPSYGLGGLFLTVASQPIGNSSPEEWVDKQMASAEGCSVSTFTTVDNDTGRIGDEECTIAVVAGGDRGYWIQLYSGDETPVGYDLAYFQEILATVQLHPEDAVD